MRANRVRIGAHTTHGAFLSLLVSALLIGTPGVFAGEEWDESVPERRLEAKVDEETVVDLHLPAGEVYIGAAEHDLLTARMVVRCKDDSRECDRLAEQLAFVVDTDDDRIDIDTRGWKSNYGDSSHVLVEVAMPKVRRVYVSMPAGSVSVRELDARSLDLRLKAGEVRVRDGVACPRIDLMAGEVRVTYPERLAASVRIDAGIGEAELITGDGPVRGRRSWLLGSEVEWDYGKGDCDLDLDIQVGEGRVELSE